MGQKIFHLVYICIPMVVEVKKTNFKVQKNLISLFLYHDLGKVIAARPATDHSYRNLVKRWHCIANLGL